MNRVCYFINDTDADNGEITPCVAEENVAGYNRVNYSWHCSMKTAKDFVRDMNERMGLAKLDALTIIASSMRAQNLRKAVADDTEPTLS